MYILVSVRDVHSTYILKMYNYMYVLVLLSMMFTYVCIQVYGIYMYLRITYII